MEEHDWADSVPRIYRDVLDTDLEWVRYETPAFSTEEQTVLKGICDRHELPVEMLAKLIELERSLQGVSRRASIQRKLSSILEEEWRSDVVILEESTT
jgi:DNA sulfur modification protein DndC